MRRFAVFFCAGLTMLQLGAPMHAGPYDGKAFRGRIAYSSDGNHNDEDDWAASPVALAIFAAAGLKDRLVHFDYNSILPKTDPEWETIHAASVLGAARHYGYPIAIFHDSQKDLQGSVESIRKAIDDSTAADPLYFIIAGPMEVAYLAIQKSDPAKRQFVHIISHSRWNDGFSPKYTFTHTKRSVIPSGIHWVQIGDQNRLLSTSPYGRPATAEEWTPWYWMRDASDPKIRFLWERMRVSKRADCSDAGMAYFLAFGDEEGSPEKLRKLLRDQAPPEPVRDRSSIRIEAENFRTLENYELEFKDDRAVSHRINLRITGDKGRIATPFSELFVAPTGTYDVEVRYLDEKEGNSEFALYVNGLRKGEVWTATSGDPGWKVHTISNLAIRTGDEIAIAVTRDGAEAAKIDYVQLNRRGAATRPLN